VVVVLVTQNDVEETEEEILMTGFERANHPFPRSYLRIKVDVHERIQLRYSCCAGPGASSLSLSLSLSHTHTHTCDTAEREGLVDGEIIVPALGEVGSSEIE
jgi:hypothetical protein